MAVDRKRVPPHLYARYGIRPNNPWPKIGVGTVLLSLVAVLVAVGSGLGPGEEIKLIRWESEEVEASVVWSAVRYDSATLYCAIRAQDEDRFDVGFAVVQIQANPDQQVFNHVLQLSQRAFTVDTPSCVENPEDLITPHFRPGLLPPAQIPPLYAPWQPLP